MKLTIFGASGRTGTHLAEQALAAGHDVVALMRNPAKLTLRHERLRVAQGDLTDEAAVADAVRGADAVLAALSPKIFGGPRDLPLASGTGNILAAMRAHGVRRLVYSWGPSILISRNPLLRALRSASFALFRLLPATRSFVNESAEVGEAIRGSDRGWTIVVVTAPNDKPGSGRVKVRTGTGTGDRVARASPGPTSRSSCSLRPTTCDTRSRSCGSATDRPCTPPPRSCTRRPAFTSSAHQLERDSVPTESRCS